MSLHPVGHAEGEGAADARFEQSVLPHAVGIKAVLFIGQVLGLDNDLETIGHGEGGRCVHVEGLGIADQIAARRGGDAATESEPETGQSSSWWQLCALCWRRRSRHGGAANGKRAD